MDLGDAKLQPLRVLGEGTFGRVFLCRCRGGKQQLNVCVKRIIVVNPRVEIKMILEEVYIISQLKHPHIVQFIRSFVHAGTVNIVMEYLPNGTMREVIDRSHRAGGMPQAELLRYFCDILMGLEYLHIRHVIHRDLKPENLLLDAEHRIKIADFGISAVHTPYKRRLFSWGTPFYAAPEIINGGRCDFMSDIWSLGCVLYEMCLGQHPFGQARDIQQLRYLTRTQTRPKLNYQAISGRYGAVWSRLCEQMLIYRPKQRISLPHILCMDAEITIPYYRQYFDYKY